MANPEWDNYKPREEKPRVRVVRGSEKNSPYTAILSGQPGVSDLYGEGRTPQEAIGDLFLRNRVYINFVEVEVDAGVKVSP